MDRQTLTDLIKKIAAENQIGEESLYEELVDILNLKYGVTLMRKERAVLDEVRNKVLTRLYNTDGHVIERNDTDEQRYFRLDTMEMRYLDQSLEELAREGLVQSDKRRTQLTDAGILKYREFYGEI